MNPHTRSIHRQHYGRTSPGDIHGLTSGSNSQPIGSSVSSITIPPVSSRRSTLNVNRIGTTNPTATSTSIMSPDAFNDVGGLGPDPGDENDYLNAGFMGENLNVDGLLRSSLLFYKTD